MKHFLLSLIAATGITATASAQSPRIYDTASSTIIRYPSKETGAATLYKGENAGFIVMNVMLVETKSKKNGVVILPVADNATEGTVYADNSRRARKKLRMP